MISPEVMFNSLKRHGIDMFAGVPDSLLSNFCAYVDDHGQRGEHIITANEGNAVALAAGYHMSTGKIGAVYMQNSGLGNTINPLTSLTDPEVYKIPLLMIIGWRGEPGVKDEPQHVKQGKIQLELLDTMDIPYEIISSHDDQCKDKISRLVETAKNNKRPVVLLVKKGTFETYDKDIKKMDDQRMLREEALEIILEHIDENTIVVSTTGKTSREIFEIREKRNESHQQDFLTVGSMGHCSSIALGIALAKPNRQVVCIDGDGALLMHLGSLTSIASLKPENFRHILINNEVHESVGGQDTAAKNVNLSAIVKSIGSSKMFKAETHEELKETIIDFITGSGPAFLEVKIRPGSRDDLGRPTIKPVDNKENFMAFLEK